MFWKIVVSALLLPSCLGFETVAAHITNKVQNQPQSQESTLPVNSTLANQSLMNSSTLANKEDSSIQSNLETDIQVKQTKYEYYQNIHRQRLRRSRYRAYSKYRHHRRRVRHHRRYHQNRVYYRQNRHPRRHYYRYQRQNRHPRRHYYRYQRQYHPQNYYRQHNYRCQHFSHGRCYN
jgi:hypothetical protein